MHQQLPAVRLGQLPERVVADGQEGFRLGGWFSEFWGKDVEQWATVSLDEALGTEALLGRRTDE